MTWLLRSVVVCWEGVLTRGVLGGDAWEGDERGGGWSLAIVNTKTREVRGRGVRMQPSEDWFVVHQQFTLLYVFLRPTGEGRVCYPIFVRDCSPIFVRVCAPMFVRSDLNSLDFDGYPRWGAKKFSTRFGGIVRKLPGVQAVGSLDKGCSNASGTKRMCDTKRRRQIHVGYFGAQGNSTDGYRRNGT